MCSSEAQSRQTEVTAVLTGAYGHRVLEDHILNVIYEMLWYIHSGRHTQCGNFSFERSSKLNVNTLLAQYLVCETEILFTIKFSTDSKRTSYSKTSEYHQCKK